MNSRDEAIREKLLDRLTAVDVDARSLAVEVTSGVVVVRGAVPSEEQRHRAVDALIGAHTLDIVVRPLAARDSDDGRGARRSAARPLNQRITAGIRPIRHRQCKAAVACFTRGA